LEKDIIESKEFAIEVRKSIKGIIELLIAKGQPFSIVAKSDYVSLSPHLDYIFDKFPDFMRFDLVEYSFETSTTDESNLIFRAGFGSGNDVVETEVKVPLHRVFQIILGTAPIFINFAETKDELEVKKRDRSQLFKTKNQNLFK